MNIITLRLVGFTEAFLTFFRNLKKKKNSRKVVHDWIRAFIWAALVVLVINQYFFQAFINPTSSMKGTIQAGDRIFVDKFIYGPELLPGKGKLQGLKDPERGDVVIFENPEFESPGAFKEISRRLIFMLSFSLMDLNRDTHGHPRVQFMIKRIVGTGGDTVRFKGNRVEIKPRGEKSFRDEVSFSSLESAVLKGDPLESLVGDETGLNYRLNPSDMKMQDSWYHMERDIYVPEGWFLVLGDNRGNSVDSRDFGLIHSTEILGKAVFRFWPFSRLGYIE